MTMNATIVLEEGTDSPTAVTIKELSVGEIREWLAEMQKGVNVGYIDALLIDGVTLQDLERMSSLTMEQIDKLSPTQLARVADAARERNSHFFEFRQSVLRIGKIPEA